MEKSAANVLGQQERQSVNITKVEELICSQENATGTHKSPLEIEQITRIARSSVVMLTDFFADRRPIAASLHYLWLHITSYKDSLISRILNINL